MHFIPEISFINEVSQFVSLVCVKCGSEAAEVSVLHQCRNICLVCNVTQCRYYVTAHTRTVSTWETTPVTRVMRT